MNETLSQTNDEDIEDFSFKDLNITGKITSVYDADTCKVCFYYRKKIIKINCRLLGIDSPEIRPSLSNKDRLLEKKASKIARNRLIQLVTNCEIELNKEYKKKELKKLLKTNKKLLNIKLMEGDKYGRVLINIYDKDIFINDLLIKEGFAYKYVGGTKKSFKEWFNMDLL